ncbi:FAD-binding oxidoreductase [Parerythrobacter aestuarii]|uniref:FAD-binding oxidoreductase n=1 Tax=Parerythrobacter aestuarii TaxID=3020909 RepID=UPI0024DE6A35|nr:FAD-dependent oxidoreductase [Parerythrobacter aestuarii]
MELTLPPRISPSAFDAALKDFESAIGRGWVLATDQDRDAYSDIYAPGSSSQWPASAAVAPASTEEVQEVVRLANRHKTPLWPVSRGKNLGYGTAAPRMPGSVVLDLSRMMAVRELDTELAYAVIEPGVSFMDMFDHLTRAEASLWMSVPGNGWGSVLGNALDHGMGYTPYGQHAKNLCGLEVVLPSGELMHTGMGAMAGNKSAHLFPLSYGPDWTHMFTQSNMGVVTSAGLWLQPEPETSLQLTWDIPEEQDIGWVIDTVTPLKLAGVIDQNVFIPSWLGKIVLKGQRKDFWDKDSAIPEWRVQELLKEHRLGYWQVQVRLYGDEGVNKARAEVIKKAFKQHLDAPAREDWWRQGEERNQYDPTVGVPSAIALQMGDWVGGRSGHMGFSPVVPATGKNVLDQLARSRKIIADHDVDFYASFTIGGRFATNINMLMYDRDNAAQVANMRKLFSTLIAETAKAGYGEYRTHLGWMDEVNATYDFNNGIQRRLNEAVKDAIDPNGIIGPGKQGVWPAAFRDMKKEGQA